MGSLRFAVVLKVICLPSCLNTKLPLVVKCMQLDAFDIDDLIYIAVKHLEKASCAGFTV